MLSDQRPNAEPLYSFDWQPKQGPTLAVIRALEETTETDLLEVEPLYTAVDTDALETLCDDGVDSNCSVGFDYLGYHVVVEASGTGRIFAETSTAD